MQTILYRKSERILLKLFERRIIMEWIVSILSSSILTNILLLLLLIACWRIWSATNQIEYDAYYIAKHLFEKSNKSHIYEASNVGRR